LGTAGALTKVIKDYKLFYEDVLVINGDTFLDINVDEFIKFHFNKKSSLTMALTKVENSFRFGKVELDKNNKLFTIEKGHLASGLINTGWNLINVTSIPMLKHRGSIDIDIFPFIEEKYGYIVNSFFLDIGVPEDLEKARKIWI
jgi:D-glycero-alpha-D-manno-heptose 1-phosphate guanylyltransferase